MNVAQVNTTCGVGSTGKICTGISKILTEQDHSSRIIFSSRTNGDPLGIQCSADVYIKLQALLSRIKGNYGFNSRAATRRMIDVLEGFKPDVIHLHNLHGHDCDLEMLFRYFRESRAKLAWTFHDCWAFTGYCPHFTMMKCEKWKYGCDQCVQRWEFSWFFDRSRALFEKKRELLQGLDMTIVAPSQWLADLVTESFLTEYPVHVINNGIDLSVFHPTDGDFRQRYGLQNKKIVLGVAFGWGRRKGLDVFGELAGRLPDEYQIVLVGTDDAADRELPGGILSIHRTQNQQELAQIYTAADVFVNPTREEVLGLTNIEALACGTPGITFRTGGSPECYDETCGCVVECDDVDALEREIVRVCTTEPYTPECCINRAKRFDQNKRFKEYLELYERIITSGNQRG